MARAIIITLIIGTFIEHYTLCPPKKTVVPKFGDNFVKS